jgi:hypothetical protein
MKVSTDNDDEVQRLLRGPEPAVHVRASTLEWRQSVRKKCFKKSCRRKVYFWGHFSPVAFFRQMIVSGGHQKFCPEA